MGRRWLRRLFAVAVVAVLALALWPFEVPVPLPTGFDKAGHVAAFAALGLLGMAAWPSARARVLVFLLAYGAAIEMLQGLSGYRHADWRDFLADALGLAIVALAARFLHRRAARGRPRAPGRDQRARQNFRT